LGKPGRVHGRPLQRGGSRRRGRRSVVESGPDHAGPCLPKAVPDAREAPAGVLPAGPQLGLHAGILSGTASLLPPPPPPGGKKGEPREASPEGKNCRVRAGERKWGPPRGSEGEPVL
jgi:hypothetical protein